MQFYPQSFQVFMRTVLEQRLYADFDKVTPETLPALLGLARELVGGCFGCGQYMTPRECKKGTGLCRECQSKRQWEMN
jgi:hypothetical protein